MTLSPRQIDELLRLAGLTAETELNCDQCLALVAEFAEQELAGRSVCEALGAVRQHLAICGECREEYQALQTTLDRLGNSPRP